MSPRAAGGFSLVELMVALAIAALLVATSVSAVSAALSAQARAAGTAQAVSVARNLVAELELAPAVGERRGEERIADHLYRWRVIVVPRRSGGAVDAGPERTPLLQATVEVDWLAGGSARALSASTLVFGPPEADR